MQFPPRLYQWRYDVSRMDGGWGMNSVAWRRLQRSLHRIDTTSNRVRRADRLIRDSETVLLEVREGLARQSAPGGDVPTSQPSHMTVSLDRQM